MMYLWKRTATVKVHGCVVPKNINPPSVHPAYQFSERFRFERWACAISNTANLLQRIGHHDICIQHMLGTWMSKGPGKRQSVERRLRDAGYYTFHLPKEINYSRLVHITHQLCLPLSVPLSVDIRGVIFHSHHRSVSYQTT